MSQAPSRAPLDHLAALRRAQDAFLASIGEVDPDARIPWCGRWRVRHLVVHLGRVHHWAAAQASKRQEGPLGRGPFVLDAFYAAQATELRETLERLADTEGWTLRRQRARVLVAPATAARDMRAPVGPARVVRAGRRRRPVLWADTVDEVVTVMQPRQQAMGRMAPLPAPVRLVATDLPAEWLLGGPGSAPVSVEARAQDLALLVWGRLAPADVRVHGDARALDEALGARLTP